MGGIVKSIGKTIKKLGKSVGKFLKKYRTTIILAAAVWAGLGAFGASYSSGSMFGLESVKAGVGRIFGFGPAANMGKAVAGMPPGPGAHISAASLAEGAAKSPNILSGIGKWLGGMESWQKYALTQGGMTMLGSLLDSSEEDVLAAKYGGMGIPYGKETPENKQLDPSHRIVSYDQWTNPASTSSLARTGSSGQSSGARSPGVIGTPYMQQVSSAPMRSLDVSSPGIISGGRPGLLGSSSQRRYA
tara:strand:- start:666 stop:1400 length:735 start_codon:yes stop_codon:yes gene_type:complete